MKVGFSIDKKGVEDKEKKINHLSASSFTDSKLWTLGWDSLVPYPGGYILIAFISLNNITLCTTKFSYININNDTYLSSELCQYGSFWFCVEL